MTPELLKGKTMHRRFGGPDNVFTYGVDYALVDPEAVPAGLPALFSRNRFNLAAIHDRDHGGPPGKGAGAAWARRVLREAGLEGTDDMRLLLLTQPRILGHLFNPVSFWMVMDDADRLRAVIPEVNNTFGERHSYLCAHPDLRPILPEDVMTAEKVFYVSPFQPVEGLYRFNFDMRPDRIAIRIEYRREGGGLLATLAGVRGPLTSRRLVAAALRRPVGSVRVLALIHGQALKLWARGARYHARPAPPDVEVTR